jgi:predicted MPP superfamily phosphohydrolase
MILWFIAVTAFAALGVDFFIYRRAIRGCRSVFLRRAYIVWAVVVDMGVVAALMLFRSAEGGAGWAMHGAMWTIALFFIHLAPRLVYFVVSVLNYPVGWIAGRKVRGFSAAAFVLAVCTLGVMIWSATAGRSLIKVKEIEIASPHLPAAFDGMRVVQFNDLHLGNLSCRDRFIERMVAKINSLQADMVVQCGDLVNIHSGELDAGAMAILSCIEAREGVYAAVGNHDLGFYIHDTVKVSPSVSVLELFDKQREMGWRVLKNSTEYIVRGEDSIAVSGVNYPLNDHTLNAHREVFAGSDLKQCFKSLPDSVFNIMLSHTPRLWDEIIAEGGADLTLSGHVHAMQMKLGFGKYVFSPARLMYKYWSGLYEREGNALYINDGMGYVMYPIRINVRPELTLITLRRR